MVYQYALRLAARLKSGGPSLGRSPGAHKQRRPANQDQIQFCGEIGSTQFLEQGFSPCSFFREAFHRCRKTPTPLRRWATGNRGDIRVLLIFELHRHTSLHAWVDRPREISDAVLAGKSPQPTRKQASTCNQLSLPRYGSATVIGEGIPTRWLLPKRIPHSGERTKFGTSSSRPAWPYDPQTTLKSLAIATATQ
jgi:hypothetical protein